MFCFLRWGRCALQSCGRERCGGAWLSRRRCNRCGHGVALAPVCALPVLAFLQLVLAQASCELRPVFLPAFTTKHVA